jgi:hypothetical protein
MRDHLTRLASIAAALVAAIAAAGCETPTKATSPSVATVVVQSVSVTGSTPAVGGTSQLTAQANLSDGSTRNVSPEATWFSSNTAVVTVSAAGMAAGVGAGQAVVQATFQGLTGVLPMNVVILLPPPPNLADVFVCDKRADDASDINRTLYVQSYPSNALSQIDLGFTSRDTPGSYSVQLTVIVNRSTAGTRTASISVGSMRQRAPATFTFSPPLSIAPGSTVRLVAERISGPGELSYEGQADSSCPVLVTADRNGETQIIGPKIPVRVVGSFP